MLHYVPNREIFKSRCERTVRHKHNEASGPPRPELRPRAPCRQCDPAVPRQQAATNCPSVRWGRTGVSASENPPGFFTAALRNERDYDALKAAVPDGRVAAQLGA